MNIVLVVLIVALVAKDTSYLGDPYIMRGFAQGLCLIVGGIWLITNFSSSIVKKYWAPLGYLLAILFATLEARDPAYVLLQVTSLAAVIFFFIAYFETQKRKGYPSAVLMNVTLLTYSLVAILSLVMAKYLPSLAYERLYGGEIRFRGLFAKAGMMGSAAGLLLGLAWFGIKRKWLKLVPMLVAAICLGLTLSRTFWVALILAGIATVWRYQWVAKKWVVGIVVAGLLVASFSMVFDVRYDTRGAKEVIRVGSIANLTGRTALWEAALNAFKYRPLLGYGFTMGADGLGSVRGRVSDTHAFSIESGRDVGRATMHSGYIQSLLDSGLVGTFFYVSVMFIAIKLILKFGKEKRFAPYFFGLLFLMISNISQNVIYTASVYDGILFWAIAIFALSLRGGTGVRMRKPESAGMAYVNAV